jgi:hypothetical protein
MADDKPSKLCPPRWAMIHILALIMWIILDVLHGGSPWGPHPGDRGIPQQADRARSGHARTSWLRFLCVGPPPSDRLLRSQPPLMPYRRRITVRRQSGGVFAPSVVIRD